MRHERITLPLLTAAILIAIWWGAVWVADTRIFPSPLEVARAIVELGQRGLLFRFAADSLIRVSSGYGFAVAFGIPIGLLLGWHAWLSDVVNPLIQMLRPISALAWMPLAVIWFGVSNAAPIFLIFLAAFFPIVVAVMNAVRNLSPVYLQAGRNLGLTSGQLLARVVFPAILPRLIIGLRIAFGVAWVVLVASEMIAVDSGLGYLIIDARNAGKRYDLVVAGMFLIGVIGLGLDILLRLIERAPAVRWGFRD